MNYKNTDPDYFTIFALGKRAHSRENVYMPWRKTEKPVHLDDFIYAIDYGFNHPTAMVKIWYTPEAREVWIEEVIYESGLTSKDIIDRMKKAGVDPTKIIVSETARPEIIADIKRSGYSIITANKNVSDGISCVRTFKVAISPTSDNIEKENMNYRFVKKNGHIREDVIKAWDDAMDAIRYGLMYIKKYKMGSTDKPQVYSFEF
jgi:phage terminase large subunit